MATSPFLEMIRDDIRLRGYSIRTEKTYLFWIKQFILFNNKRHPSEMGVVEVKAFLTWQAVERHVATNTQKVALNAVVFLYHKFLKQELGVIDFAPASKQRHLPAVLIKPDVRRPDCDTLRCTRSNRICPAVLLRRVPKVTVQPLLLAPHYL